MYDAYPSPKDTLRPIAVTLEAVQFIAPDPEDTDLAHKLVIWALETAVRTSATQRNPPEGKSAWSQYMESFHAAAKRWRN